MGKKKVVVVGTGVRGLWSYMQHIVRGHLSDICELCGVYDIVPSRARNMRTRLAADFPIFDDFDTMLDTVRPDFVLVTTIDSNHHEYIIRALDKGYDVISEKPLTNTRKKALAIMEAEKRSGHKVRVIFNMRYMKPFEDLKRVIRSGVIGEVKHVDFQWLLDRDHGADYYRRWHRYMKNTTSLLVHKSTHHFDVINWVLGKRPVSVYADCTLDFYGKCGPYRGASCHDCAHTAECPFFWDILSKENINYKLYYHDVYPESHYNRDGCVFAEDIDIFDRMSLLVRYEGGVTMNYSLVTYADEEGPRFRFVGTKGTVEMEYYASGPRAHTKRGTTFADEVAASGAKVGGDATGTIAIRILPAGGEEQVVLTGFTKAGEHGGADVAMRDDIFRAPNPNDDLGHVAPSIDGYYSLAIGDMAVASVKAGRPVGIDELLD
ncbi:MAG: Gfo/Idh/MocA family oxidoreductase [Clostridia bacterium]|nr:Gfo/Idh/MocA family oxidoreductase [Clostridia bacterium]